MWAAAPALRPGGSGSNRSGMWLTDAISDLPIASAGTTTWADLGQYHQTSGTDSAAHLAYIVSPR